MSFSLEQLLTSPVGCGLDTASPLQRAICRAADGLDIGDLLTPEQKAAHFGDANILIAEKPSIVVVVAGVRGGKSVISAAKGIHAAITTDLSMLKPHEVARFSVVAPTVDAARATFRLLSGMLTSSSALSRYVDNETADTIMLKRPTDGRRVELTVVAARKGGISVRNRWLCGFVLDELAQFGAEHDGYVVNAEELLQAAETRLLPGCQGWLISSPYGPAGLLYDMYTAHFGKPGQRLVVHAPTRAMNPSFDQRRIDAIRSDNPDVAAREYDAQWLDADSAMFNTQHLEAAIRHEPLDLSAEPRCEYVAAIDPGTRANAWTLVVLTMHHHEQVGTRVVCVLARQWIGSKQSPLSPDAVMQETAELLLPYGVRWVASDIHMADALRDIAWRHGLDLHANTAITARKKLEMFEHVGALLADGRLELPNDQDLLSDLRMVRKRAGASSITIELPRTPNGRHCDYASALALAAAQPLFPPRDEEPSTRPAGYEHWTSAEYDEMEQLIDRRRARGRDGFFNESDGPFFGE